MQAKLTLSMEETVIKKAKEFAKRNQTSLSQLIEDYFSEITKKDETVEDEISQSVKNLSGILNLPKDFDLKKERANDLEKKYK